MIGIGSPRGKMAGSQRPPMMQHTGLILYERNDRRID